ncbi:PRONE domain-containing protein [Cephalotus follicularis]|uniref:PRONE domain-containing protein n=1 Tax=Cephalotus follicularis TaxID=3775 RepID=A0A1Q3D6S5_CEPFO|nr:PRONE domain-containing protein [Cephalotus follicularis]
MKMTRRSLACCTWDREISIDFDEQEGIMSYNGLESYIFNNQSYEFESGTSRGDGCTSDSLDDDGSSCSSSKDAFGSFSSKWLTMKRDEKGSNEWELSESLQHFCVKEKAAYNIKISDVETMKEKFAKLLLGEDITGGCKGLTTALALSNAITNLAASVFGELWKLEPLPEERKGKWRREMDWLLSPTNYMVELVPAKQHGANGRTMEIMTPKARADMHMNLPALKKLDSMLIETLDSMVSTEFWYAEVGSRAGGRNKSTKQSKRWWLPIPQVPKSGLSDTQRKKLINQGRVIQQVFKAAKSINENILLEMPIPTLVRDALPKSGKASLSEEMHRALTAESSSADEMLSSLNLKSEHSALDAVNRLEAAMLAWKERIIEKVRSKSPVRTSWSFMKDPLSELHKMELLVDRAEAHLQQIKTKYPNLPQTFLDATKIQYGKDIGHSILEAYSRVLGNLAFTVLSRIGEILQEDGLINSSWPVSTCCFPGKNAGAGVSEMPPLGPCCFPGRNAGAGVSGTQPFGARVQHSLIDQMNRADENFYDSDSYNVANTSSATAISRRSRIWCIGREACMGVALRNSP